MRRLTALAILLMVLSAALTGVASADVTDPATPPGEVIDNFHWT